MIPVDFEQGMALTGYLDQLKYYKSIVKRLRAEADADEDHVQALQSAVSDLSEQVRTTVMTEDWCGDSACNLPIVESLVSKAKLPVRVFHGSEYADLERYYHERGVDHIPVISTWDGNGAEVGRWIEQPEAVAPKKDAWKSARPEFMELYARRAHDRDAEKRFAVLYRQLLEEMSRWYTDGMWRETTREIVESIGALHESD